MNELKKKLNNLDEKQIQAIEKAFHSFAKAFMHQPMVKLKEFVKDNPRFYDPEIMDMKEDTE